MNFGTSIQAKREKYKRFLSLIFFCVIAVFIGLTLGYPTYLTPHEDHHAFSSIARDGWIEDGATIRLPRLSQRGNRIDLSLKSWRPEGQPPALLSFELCGEEIKRLEVLQDTTVRLFLTGGCEPRTVVIRVFNPFTPGGADQRKLGVQLSGLSLGSKLGFPVVAPQVVLLITAFVLFLVLLALEIAPISYRVPVGLILLTCSGWLLSTLQLAPFSRLFPLWGVLCVMLFGASLAQTVLDEGNSVSAVDKQRRWGRACLVSLIVALGSYFRFSGISFGLPLNYHPDEVAKLNAVMRMYNSGTLDPNYFLHPTLLLYCTYGLNLAGHAFGFFSGAFHESLILSGRLVSALAGIFSIVLTYLIGKKLFSTRAGLLAASLLAVFPLHVTCSRYLKEDSLLTFFVLLSTLFAVYALRSKKSFWLVLAGIAAGCSASVKYSGLMSVIIPVLGALAIEGRWIPRDRKVWFALVLALVAVPLAFLVCSPYVLLNSTKFVEDFLFEQQHMQNGHLFAITPWSQYWMYHVERSLYKGVTAPPFFLGLIAFGFFLRKRNMPALLVIAVLLAFYFPAEYVKAKPAPQPERYILPCLPYFALLIGAFSDQMFAKKKSFLLVSGLSLFVPLFTTRILHQELVPDTRLQMARWIEREIPHGSRIYIDHKQYSPELSQEHFQVTYAPSDRIGQELELERLAAANFDYLLLSSLWFDRYFSQPRTDEFVRRRIERVLRDGELVHSVKSSGGTYGFHNPDILLFRLPKIPS